MFTQILTKIKKVEQEIKKEKDDSFQSVVELLKTSKNPELATRSCALLLAVREGKGFYPFEKEIKNLVDQPLDKKLILALLPELDRFKTVIPDSIGLLEAICFMLAANLSKLSFAQTPIHCFLNLKYDTAKSIILLLNLPDFPKRVECQQLLKLLLPAIQSCHTDVFQAILRFGTAQILTQFIEVKYPYRKIILEAFSNQYQCGETTYFHQLCNLEDHEDIENRFQKIQVLGFLPEFKRIKAKSTCNGGGAKECLNPNCPSTLSQSSKIKKELKERKETKEIKEAKELKETKENETLLVQGAAFPPSFFEFDVLNARDAEGRTPVDFASFWMNSEHEPTLVRKIGMNICDDITSLYRMQIGRWSLILGIPASVSSRLFPKRTNEMDKALHQNAQQYNKTDGYFGSSFFPVQCSGETLNIKRLYSTDARDFNLTMRILALGELSQAIVPIVALDSDDTNHLLIGTQYMSCGSLALSLKVPAVSPFAEKLQARNEKGYALRLRVAAEVTATIELLHKKGIIHGDIEPGHILLHQNKESDAVSCKLNGLNFSPTLNDIPSHYRPAPWQEGWVTENGAIPPELIASKQTLHYTNYTTASDIYCLGAVLNWLFYFDLRDEPEKTKALKQIIEFTMAKNPQERKKAAELHEKLSSLLGVTTIKNNPIPEKTVKPKSLSALTFEQFLKGLPKEYLKSLQEKITLNPDRLFHNVPPRVFPLINRPPKMFVELKEMLKNAGCVLLFGAPGVGRATVATEYCYVNQSDYKMVVRISLDGMSFLVTKIQQALQNIDSTFTMPWSKNNNDKIDPIQKLHYLLIKSKPSLLVLENILAKDIDLCCPPIHSGVHCLVTSQEDQTSKNWQKYKSIKMSASQEDCADFFEGLDTTNVNALSSILGHSPCLLTKLAGYGHKTKQSTDEILAFVQLQMKVSHSTDLATASRGFLIQQLPLLDKSQTATDLLAFMSLLAPTTIPARWFKPFLTRLRKADDDAINTAVGLLYSLKLIHFQPELEFLDLQNSYCALHPLFSETTRRDLFIRKDAERLTRTMYDFFEEFWMNTIKTQQNEIVLLLSHIAHFTENALTVSFFPNDRLKKIKDTLLPDAARMADALGDNNLTLFIKNKIAEPLAVKYIHPKPRPSRLKIIKYASKIWSEAAYFNGGEAKPNLIEFTNVSDYLEVLRKSKNINPDLHMYLRNIRRHYAPMQVREEQWEVFFKMLGDFLQGGFFVGTEQDRIQEAHKRQREFYDEFKQSKQHTAFHLVTHAHAHLIRIFAKLANFITAHYRQDREFEQGILQLLGMAIGFGPSGNKFLRLFLKHEYGERELILVLREFDGTHHINKFVMHPEEADHHTGLYSLKISGALLTREEMEEALNDDLVKESARQQYGGLSKKIMLEASQTTKTAENKEIKENKEEMFSLDEFVPTDIVQTNLPAATVVAEAREMEQIKKERFVW